MHLFSLLLGTYSGFKSLHRYISMANSLGHFAGIRCDDIVYVTLPLYHTNGGILGVGQMIIRGSTVALRRKFSASQYWNDCIKYKCTVSQYIDSALCFVFY